MDFRSLGRGSVDFEEIIRALNDIAYQGPLSVEWEDSGMDREHGAREACEFTNLYSLSRGANRFHAYLAALDLLEERKEVQARTTFRG